MKSVRSRPHAEPERVQAALARASGGEPVQIRETHISWVFLVGDRAYKLKKPLVLPFLDYGTPARRRRMCSEEVRLNRRLSANIYLGVRGLAAVGDALELVDEANSRALDYVVEMRRYDETHTLAGVLDRGELSGADVVAVAYLLAKFHARCPHVLHDEPAHAAQREIDANLSELLPLAALRGERQRVLSLWRFQSAFVAAHTAVLDMRGRQGWIRDCHGDLRAEHVLLGAPPEVVDCVEFDPALRAVDVADDLAFLVMDLTARGGEHFALELVAAYRDAGGDPGTDALLAFYSSYRALVRAKVLLLRCAQLPSGSAAHGHASAHAREMVSLAESFAWRARLPLLIVVCGVPASGKSHLSSALAATSGFAHISSDVIRKQLAGLKPSQTAPADSYTAEFSVATYAELGRRAAAEVTARDGAIVDATFRRRVEREAFAQAFADAAPVVFVECAAPAHVLSQRAIRREHGERHASDATLAVVLRERAKWESLDEVGPEAHLMIRSDRAVERIVEAVVGWLDAQLWRAAPA